MQENYRQKFSNDLESLRMILIFRMYRKTPLLVSGVDQFSNSNSYVLDQLVAKKQNILNPVLH
jgi:hypothetical protein